MEYNGALFSHLKRDGLRALGAKMDKADKASHRMERRCSQRGGKGVLGSGTNAGEISNVLFFLLVVFLNYKDLFIWVKKKVESILKEDRSV